MHVGRTTANVALHEPALVRCSVFDAGQLLPADRALEFSVGYADVVAVGQGRVVGGGDDQRHGLAFIMTTHAAHLKPVTDYELPTDAGLACTAAFRVDVEAWLGKTKAAADDSPGVYAWPEVGAPS